MAVDALQHINIHAADVERSRDFYVRVIGLRVGPRPPVESVGYWLYLGAQPVVHLVQRNASSPAPGGSGAIDHVAFHASDLASTRRVLRAEGFSFREAVIPRDSSIQLFVDDPDGVKVELNFDPLPA